MTIKSQIERELARAFVACGLDKASATVASSNMAGVDYQCNACFALAKLMGTNPLDLCNRVAAAYTGKTALVTVSAPGFLNFAVSQTALTKNANKVLADGRIPLERQRARTVFFDYGGANIAKELHIGHLRSPIVGEALRRAFNAFGYNTIGDTHLGDFGTHMGLIIAELERMGQLREDAITLKLLGEIYPRASARKETDEPFRNRAKEIVLFLQRQTEPFYGIWQRIKAVSLPAIKKNYDRLGCTFDTFEGDNCEYAEDAIRALKKGSTYRDNGCLLMNVAEMGEHIPQTDENGQVTYKNPMPPVMIQKADGGVLYMAGDFSTIYRRHRKYAADEYIYVVDARQSLHFTQLFRGAKKGGLVPSRTKFVHVALGTVNGKDGKPFKTRSGGTVKLEEVIDEVVDAARTRLAESGRSTDPATAERIELAALKFADLSNNVRRDYIFDPERFTDFNGKTGPYLLYTVARINSILAKAGDFNAKLGVVGREILAKVVKMSDAYSNVVANYTLNPLTDAMFDLAQEFNNFYGQTNILKEQDERVRAELLALCMVVKRALEFGLNTLAIDPVESM